MNHPHYELEDFRDAPKAYIARSAFHDLLAAGIAIAAIIAWGAFVIYA